MFYLTPLKKTKGEIWYTGSPVGHHTLAKTVKRLCEQGGISGFKTNYSLRVTSATRLFQQGVDEQLIMTRTGHRSIQSVRTYKRVSGQQKREVSDLLNSATNGAHAEIDQPEPKFECDTGLPKESVVTDTVATRSLQPGILNFTGCSSITINYLTQ